MASYDYLIESLPQKPPSLFVDEITEHVHLERVRGAVSFPMGHRIFENHLPGEPLVPGVILIEALAQIAGTVMVSSEGESIRGYLGEVSRMRFRQTVGPGERIDLEARLLQRFGNAVKFAVEARVDSVVVAEGELIVVSK